MSYQLISESETWFHGLTPNQRIFIIHHYERTHDRNLDLSYANMIIDAYRIRSGWRDMNGWPEFTQSDMRKI